MNESIENILIKSLLERSGIVFEGQKIQIKKLAGDASTRKYYRIIAENISYVGCLDQPLEGKRSDFEEISNFLSFKNVQVPRIFKTYPEKGFILQEDLGDDMLVNFLSKEFEDEVILFWYKKSIDIINQLQLININELPLIVKERKFDFKKYNFELGVSNLYFLEKYLNYQFSENETIIFLESFEKIIKFLMSDKLVVIHRDFHSRNIMVKNDQLKIIDYQDLMLGTGLYDLVSLLDDSYFPLKDELKLELREYFKANNQYYAKKNDFEKMYDYNAIQRLYKALGSFTYIYALRDDDRYLKYVGIGVSRLISLLSKYDELSPVLNVILKAYHGN